MPILIDEVEHVENNFSVAFRDSLVFTNLRLIFVDRQGLRGKKVEIFSIPYERMSSFSLENAGTLDLNAELDIHVDWEHCFETGGPLCELCFPRDNAPPPIAIHTGLHINFGRGVDLHPIAKILAQHILLV